MNLEKKKKLNLGRNKTDFIGPYRCNLFVDKQSNEKWGKLIQSFNGNNLEKIISQGLVYIQ